VATRGDASTDLHNNASIQQLDAVRPVHVVWSYQIMSPPISLPVKMTASSIERNWCNIV